MLQLADSMGLMVWSEIPLWQKLKFEDTAVYRQAQALLTSMIEYDKNRGSIIFWSVANETPISDERNLFLKNLVQHACRLDSTRLITAATDKYSFKKVTVEDLLGEFINVISVNEYMGWYNPWQGNADKITWTMKYRKPLIMSEFGGEALYGNHGDSSLAHSWSEEFQEDLYRKQLAMMRNIPFLQGLLPCILVDFRSPVRNNN